jgi:exopolyphosphatase / guanosine-5'-triphosphate,3'-diphosphate pyrophosphatase
MGQQPLKVGVVDIGTNSMRLLVTTETVEIGRWVEVTGLGRGVDASGSFSPDALDETLEVLARYGRIMDGERVDVRKAIATSASRDASNRDDLFDRAETALGVRPTLISGEEEARLAFAGVDSALELIAPIVVSDIGGGSTEFVTATGGLSVDIGSVRLTERALPSRPASGTELSDARRLVADLFAGVDHEAATVVGVAGTWTSLCAIVMDLPVYSREAVHGHRVKAEEISDLVDLFAGKTVEQTADISSLDPKRAPVILAGAVIAEKVLACLAAREVVVSESDTLDGVANELLALP